MPEHPQLAQAETREFLQSSSTLLVTFALAQVSRDVIFQDVTTDFSFLTRSIIRRIAWPPFR